MRAGKKQRPWLANDKVSQAINEIAPKTEATVGRCWHARGDRLRSGHKIFGEKRRKNAEQVMPATKGGMEGGRGERRLAWVG